MLIQETLNNQLLIDSREQNKQDLEKAGQLRAGNAAYLLSNGKLNSSGSNCIRLTWLRWKGYQPSEEHGINKLWMFAGGIGSEQVIAGLLTKAGHNVLMDTEYQIDLDGTVLSGRPDILIANPEGKPVLGLELKKVSSVWTAKEVINNGKPKSDHLCQAALYSHMVQVPYKLVYVQYDNYAAFTIRGLSEEARNVDRDDKGKPINLVPYLKVYDVQIGDGGKVLYKHENGKHWQYSGITIERILAYYRKVKSLDDQSTLPPRPESYDVEGEKAGYTTCKYCPYSSVCANFKDGADTINEWKDQLLSEGLIKHGKDT
jgi:hypothetical protein